MRFANRTAAGRALAADVAELVRRLPAGTRQPLVLALPRGGVPVGVEVARALGADLDVTVARKIGAPGHAELGVGAVAEDEQPVFDLHHLGYLGLRPEDLIGTVHREIVELRRRVALYRGGRPAPEPAGRLVVVVDDGLATGVTARAALRSLRAHRPGQLIFAAPVGAADSADALIGDADQVVLTARPSPFGAVGAWYDDFDQISDEEVVALLTEARSHRTATAR